MHPVTTSLVQAPEEQGRPKVADQSTPRRAPVVLAFPYRLSTAGQDRYVATTGTKPPTRFVVRLDLTKLPPELRARAAGLRIHLPSISSQEPPPLYELALTTTPVLDEATEDPASVIAAWEALLLRQEQERQSAAAAQRQREEAAAKESKRFREQMGWWIADKGSEALRVSHQRGYNVGGLYLRERVAKEFPGFEIDSKNKAKWEERANPSPQALTLETETLDHAARSGSGQVRIVWLTRGIDGTDYKPLIRFRDAPHPREAVVVVGFLGRYTLVREVAPEAVR